MGKLTLQQLADIVVDFYEDKNLKQFILKPDILNKNSEICKIKIFHIYVIIFPGYEPLEKLLKKAYFFDFTNIDIDKSISELNQLTELVNIKINNGIDVEINTKYLSDLSDKLSEYTKLQEESKRKNKIAFQILSLLKTKSYDAENFITILKTKMVKKQSVQPSTQHQTNKFNSGYVPPHLKQNNNRKRYDFKKNDDDFIPISMFNSETKSDKINLTDHTDFPDLISAPINNNLGIWNKPLTIDNNQPIVTKKTEYKSKNKMNGKHSGTLVYIMNDKNDKIVQQFDHVSDNDTESENDYQDEYYEEDNSAW